jgi:excisionase family DNA binding protein
MRQTDLFLLHPVAYGQAHDVLQQEADMIRSGHGRDQRVDFLTTELDRLMELADVSMAEALGSVLPATIGELAAGLDEIRARFARHGFTGTLRTMRNLQRRHGLAPVGLDPLLVRGALGVLEHDPAVLAAVEGLLSVRMQAILGHPAVRQAEEHHAAIMAAPELPSVRDRRLMALARTVLIPVLEELEPLQELSNADVRHLACLHGRILDVPFVDILLVLISNGGIHAVTAALRASLPAAGVVHRHVLQTVIGARLRALGEAEAPEPHAEDMPMAEQLQPNDVTEEDARRNAGHTTDSLLSVKDAMAYLNISRQTLHRLVTDGALVPVRIGRAVRFARADLERFVGR